ncbi:MAG: ROK family protein [Candidatus Promineifilaceae bacterium]
MTATDQHANTIETLSEWKSSPGLFVGLDIGGTKTAVLVSDRSMNVLGWGTAPTVTSSPQALVEGIYRAVEDVLAARGLATDDLLAVGAGVPGMVDPQTGIVQLAVNLNLHTFPLGSALSERFGVPVVLENDVRAASLGAYRWLKNISPQRFMAYLSIGTGISAGLVADGRLYRGAHGMAGEIGHVIFDPDGDRCACGLSGCLETISAGPSIARQWAHNGGTAEEVFAAAKQGDLAAQLVIQQAAQGVARAVQLLVMAYDVDRVVLGGGVMNAGDVFLEPIYAALAEMRAQSPLAERMLAADKVVAAPKEADVARWGAVMLAFLAFDNPGAFSLAGTRSQIGLKKNA